jgi:biopolymer transport protein ExbB/TolQ
MTDKNQLNEALQALRDEIDNLNTDESRKQSLNALADQVEQQFDDSSNSENQGLIESLEETISEFEVEHPALTSIINRLLVTLSNMGI